MKSKNGGNHVCYISPYIETTENECGTYFIGYQESRWIPYIPIWKLIKEVALNWIN